MFSLILISFFQFTLAIICQYGGVYSKNFDRCILTMYSANYSQAEASCQSLDGSLPCISSDSQNSEILNNLQNNCSNGGGHNQWIGNGNELCNVDYSKLEDSGQSKGCITMDISSGDWKISSCEKSFPFQCTYPLQNECETDWMHYDSSCFIVISLPFTQDGYSWFQSQQYCTSHFDEFGAYLTSILSLEENNFIVSISMVSHVVANSLWLGLYMIDDSDYKWADGSGVTYQNFVITDSGQLPCGSMTLQDDELGQWLTNNCTEKMRNFVCRYDL